MAEARGRGLARHRRAGRAGRALRLARVADVRADRRLGGRHGGGPGGAGVVRRSGAPPRRAGHPVGRATAGAGGRRRRRAGPAPIGRDGRGLRAARLPSTRSGPGRPSSSRRCCLGWARSTGPIWRPPRRCARPRWPKSWPMRPGSRWEKPGRAALLCEILVTESTRRRPRATLVTVFERVFDNLRVFPAVRAS